MTNMSGISNRNWFRQLPNALGMIDAFSVHINWTFGRAQQLSFRRDRGFFFLNFDAAVDNQGYFQFVAGGYLLHDYQTWSSENNFTYRTTCVS